MKIDLLVLLAIFKILLSSLLGYLGVKCTIFVNRQIFWVLR